MSKAVRDFISFVLPHEHILMRPDRYVGCIERIGEEMWIFDEATGGMTRRQLSFVPGLYKIFDDILVNAADNKLRDPEGQTLMKVDIDPDEKRISVWNNGRGIPIQHHDEHRNLWIPEVLFGYLPSDPRTLPSNWRPRLQVTNVYSLRFDVETVCAGKKFKMQWSNNMFTKGEPAISSTDDEDFTCVTFWPDLAKFGMTELEEDMMRLMKRRAYDIAGTTDQSMRVMLNNVMLPVIRFTDLVDLYPTVCENKAVPNRYSYVKVGDRWEVCVGLSNVGFQQVSFVNCIATTKGGTHVRNVLNQLVDAILPAAEKKISRRGMTPRAYMVKQDLFVFVNSLTDNPIFSSQTKEELKTDKSKFGSECELPEDFIAAVLNTNIVERVVSSAESGPTCIRPRRDNWVPRFLVGGMECNGAQLGARLPRDGQRKEGDGKSIESNGGSSALLDGSFDGDDNEAGTSSNPAPKPAKRSRAENPKPTAPLLARQNEASQQLIYDDDLLLI